MSTTLLIGRWPAALRRAFSHSGDGPIVTFSNARTVKRGHSSVRTSTRRAGDRVAGGVRVLRPRRRAQRGAGRGVHLARDAVDAQAVGAVRRDLELEHVGGDRQDLEQRRAGRGAVVEHHDPGVVGADRELVLGQDHPRRLDAAQLGLAELRAVGHHRAGPRDRDGLARPRRSARRRRSAPARPSPTSTMQTVSRSASGWCSALSTRPMTNPSTAPTPWLVDALDLGPGQRQALGELAQAEVRPHVLVKPVERDPHPNCSRKRRSLS